MLKNAQIGQVAGPFTAGVDLLDDDQAIGSFTPEKERPEIYKLGIQALPGTIVAINGRNIKIGSTGIYELDDVVKIKSLVFPNGAPNTTILDFIYAGYMNY